MTWAKFEDRFPWNRKVRGLTDSAFRLHVSAICWSCEHLTDGKVETDDLPLVSDVRRPERALTELVRRGLWDVIEVGWSIHDFLEFNESREVILARREADAERKRRGRENRKGSGSPPGVPSDVQPDSPMDSGRTEPNRTEPTKTVGARKRATPPPDVFPITPAMRQWGAAHAPLVADPEAETRQFLDHHRAKGSTMKDWTAAWRTWMGNAQKFASQRPGRQLAVVAPDDVDEWRHG